MRRHYYALCTQVDENIGRILSCLDELSLADSTIVVFTSDHGDFLGEHGLLFKEHLYDGSLRVPLLVRDPRRKPARCPALAESIDIMPTVLDLVGVSPPAGLRGESLAHCMDRPDAPHREAVFSEWTTHCVNGKADVVSRAATDPNIKSIRTAEWRYTHYTREAGELYDLEKDPLERWNLFGKSSSRDVIDRLRANMLDWIMSTEPVPNAGTENPYFHKSLSAKT